MKASLILAVQFLTRIPLNIPIQYSEQRWGQSVLFYPLVGLLIGSLLALFASLLPSSHTSLNAALLLSLWVLITGGLHLDGLADCSDAWAGGLGDKARTLAIMKDPAAGPIAVIILLLVLLLKWSALTAILEQGQAFIPLLIAPLLGRTSILCLMLSTPYVSDKGLGAEMLKHLSRNTLISMSLGTLVFSIWLSSITLLLLPLVTFFAIRFLAMQRLQGVTGDVYGASVELIEASVLINWVFYYG